MFLEGGIVTEESGAPLDLGVSGTTASSILTNTGMRPDLTGSISYPHKVGQWFAGNFSKPACVTGPDCYGNLGFDAIRGPGRNNFNLSLLKNFTDTCHPPTVDLTRRLPVVVKSGIS